MTGEMNSAMLKVLIGVNMVLMVAGLIAWVLLYLGTSELGLLVDSINKDRHERTIIIRELREDSLDTKRRLRALEEKQR